VSRPVLVLSIALAIALMAPASTSAAEQVGGGMTAPSQAATANSGGGLTYGAQLTPKSDPAVKRRKAAKRRAERRKLAARRKQAAERKRRARARRRAARERERERAQAPAATPAPVSDHVFPVQGPFSYGGEDSRFGAKRHGHTHQGQDLSAPLGTPLVAPHSGTIKTVSYQASGAGHYLVIDGADEERDYVFMHLLKGSILVDEGDMVATGQRIADVGSSGSSTGPHLHFEIWIGKGWFTGGRPIDPLPLLRSWPA
jgi:murein DD-endopeptidase MepM/ murein hydrolase activator NlpD